MSTHRPARSTVRRALRACGALAALVALGGCPELPDMGGTPDPPDDPDAFVPLSLDRVVASSGSEDGGERVTIYGAGIEPGATVRFGGGAGTSVLVLDAGRVNATVPPRARGLVDVTVELLDGQRATLQDAYLYRGPLALTGIEPAMSPIAGGVVVTVTGSGFTDETRVFIGDRMLEDADRVDGNTIVGTAPGALATRAGAVDVVVSDGFEQRLLSGAFRYVDRLRVDWLYPASGPAGGGTELTLYGQGIDRDTEVTIGGVTAEIVAPGHGGAIVVRTPPGPHGPADIGLSSPAESVTVAGAFYYFSPSETPTGLWLAHAWPPEGPMAGGTQVALSVTGLPATGGVTVTFNDQPATVIETRRADNLLVVATPPGVAGPARVRVMGGGQETARETLFAYRRALTAHAVEPDFGGSAGGETVRIRGEGFGQGSIVTFGGRPAQVVDVNLNNLEVRAPRSVPGRVDVVVEDGDRRAVIPAGYEFRADGAARVWAVSPAAGSRAGGRIVRVHGEGFRAQRPILRFGPNLTESVTIVDDALVIARAPKGDVGEVNVYAGGQGLLAMAYAYFDPGQRYGGTAGGPIPEALNVTVLDTSNARGVDGAFVILWDDLGTPYQGVTDRRGQITFSDVGFGPRQMVTASADNYTTASVVDFDARDVTLHLIPLIASPPGNGGGGGGQPLPGSTLAGKVTGLDKYVLPPPGSCDNRLLLGAPDTLCQPCSQDAQCDGPGARCTDLGPQGGRCTVACSTNVDCPEGYACAGVAHGEAQCLPSPGRRLARCSTTRPHIFSDGGGPSLFVRTDDQGLYSISSRPGEYAVVCLGGYEDELGEFIPTMMGVRRHVFATPGDVVARQDVRLDIPLTRTLRVRLDDPPDTEETALRTVDVYIDFGPDGVFHMPSSGRALGTEVFRLEHFPIRFAESLYNASYTVYASAVPNLPREAQTGAGTFTLHEDLTEIDDDAVYEILPDRVARTRTGISHDIFALHGAGDGRILAAGAQGRVIVFDGSLWGLQQAPTQEHLRGIWAATTTDAWAVGDRGAVVRWDGLRWHEVPMPAALGAVNWAGVEGVGDGVWLWGEAGVWAHDGFSAEQVILDITTGAVRDVWAAGPDDVWLVGDGGRIRRWTGGPQASHDLPGPAWRAIWGAAPDDVWVVGDGGRVARWDGQQWFEFLPVTSRSLTAVHATGPDDAWAVGDAGVVLRWDGQRWRQRDTVPHADLRGVWTTSAGRTMTAGQHTLLLGPFLRVPRPGNPNVVGALLDLTLSWNLDPGPEASLTWIQLQTANGFPFWNIMADGVRGDIPLPDLTAAWGLQPLWPGSGFFQIVRAYVPGFSINRYDTSILTPFAWRSWTVTGWGMTIEQAERAR